MLTPEKKGHSAEIKHVQTRLITSGNMFQTSKVPLTNIHPSSDFDDSYEITIIMYLPDYAKNVKLDGKYYPYLDEINTVDTEAGEIDVREVGIYYDTPDYLSCNKSSYEIYLYSIWEMKIRYVVLDEAQSAQAIRVRYTINDPQTTKGPITTVEKP